MPANPENIIVVKGNPSQGKGNEVFAIFPNGLIRMATPAEFARWGGAACIDRTIAFGDDAEFLQLMAYDKALRG